MLSTRLVGLGLTLALGSCASISPALSLRFRAVRTEGVWTPQSFVGFRFEERRDDEAEQAPAAPAAPGIERALCRSPTLCRWQRDAERALQP